MVKKNTKRNYFQLFSQNFNPGHKKILPACLLFMYILKVSACLLHSQMFYIEGGQNLLGSVSYLLDAWLGFCPPLFYCYIVLGL